MDQPPRLSIVDASGQQVMDDPISQAFLNVLLGGVEPTPPGTLHHEVQALVAEMAGTERVSGDGPFVEGLACVRRRLEHLLDVCAPEDFPDLEA